jgi:hypothetical protein
MNQPSQLAVQKQLDFLLAIERLFKDAEAVRRSRDRLLDVARESCQTANRVQTTEEAAR